MVASRFKDFAAHRGNTAENLRRNKNFAEKTDMSSEQPNLAHPELRRLFVLWTDKCGEEGLPSAADLEPDELRPWIPNILIMEIVSAGNFAYAYYGRSFTSAFGENRLGQTLERLPAEHRAILHAEYDKVRTERRPIGRVYTADFNGVVQTWERLVLPLSTDGATVDRMLVAAYEI
ncbi:MAG: PAS domain-containing protein [Azospirillum sp.]|nr:PAS domain-containing protein [Azospirillum sp.]